MSGKVEILITDIDERGYRPGGGVNTLVGKCRAIYRIIHYPQHVLITSDITPRSLEEDKCKIAIDYMGWREGKWFDVCKYLHEHFSGMDSAVQRAREIVGE